MFAIFDKKTTEPTWFKIIRALVAFCLYFAFMAFAVYEFKNMSITFGNPLISISLEPIKTWDLGKCYFCSFLVLNGNQVYSFIIMTVISFCGNETENSNISCKY